MHGFIKKNTILIAVAIALLLQGGIRKLDIQAFYGVINARWFDDFQQYFPGKGNLHKHEVFNPRYGAKKKIVFIGPSYTNSIGCDRSFSLEDCTRSPSTNYHFTARIDYQLNKILAKNGITDWQAFNLACNAARINFLLYVYVATHLIKPDIIIYGAGPEQLQANGGGLEQIDAMELEKQLINDDTVKDLWQLHKVNLLKGGENWDWIRGVSESSKDMLIYPFTVKNKLTIYDIVAKILSVIINKKAYNGPRLPVKIFPWEEPAVEFKTPEEPYDFSLVSGFEIINELQKKHNGKLIVYLTPLWNVRNSKTWREYFPGPFITEMNKRGIAVADLTDLPLKEAVETYDGGHQTTYGNIRIAENLFEFLLKNRLLQ
ncbi:MAG: hypothetical protein ABII23_00445 [bacterium]